MSDNHPFVSVVVCVYNAGRYLRPCIESVLAQTHRHLEVLIIDDGSTDGCVDAIGDIRDERIRVIRQRNGGKPAALNRALDEITGDFYVLQDADDLSHPRRIEKQLHCLLENADAAAVYCGHELILRNRRTAPLRCAKDREACRAEIAAFRMPGHDPTGMYRCSLVKRYRYDPALPIVEGFDYVLRIGEMHPMLAVGDCLYSYRILPHSITRRDPERRNQLVREVLRRACERRGIDYHTRFTAPTARRFRRHPESDNNLAAHFIKSVVDSRRESGRLAALATGLQCSFLHPLDPHYHKATVYAVAPRWILKRFHSVARR